MRRRAPPCFGSAIQAAALRMSSGASPVICCRLFDACLVRLHGVVVVRSVLAAMKAWSIQPFAAISREQRVEQRQVGARLDRQVQHVLRARLGLAGGDGGCAARIDEDDARSRDRLACAELGALLVQAGAAQVGHPVVQEIVCLRLQRVGADRDDGVGELGVLVAVVQLRHAHVAGAVHLAVVGRPVVDADVLDLHALEIELAGRPGVLVAAASAAMVVSRDDQPVLALLARRRGG